MKSLTGQLWFETPPRRDCLCIMGQVGELVCKNGVQEGLCLVKAMHISVAPWRVSAWKSGPIKKNPF
jgi:thiamine phosphate synthase YjbQ (UPF0047 family)